MKPFTLIALALLSFTVTAGEVVLLDGGTNNVPCASTNTYTTKIIQLNGLTDVAFQASFKSYSTTNVETQLLFFDTSLDKTLWQTNAHVWGITLQTNTTVVKATNFSLGAIPYIRLSGVGNCATESTNWVTNVAVKAFRKD
jgi:hypothetical protein